MRIKNFLLTLLLFLFIVFGFFYKTVLNKQVPFPGDLLVAEYNPWKSYSFLGYNPGSYPNKAQYFDTLRQIYPWKTFIINSIKNNSFPLWNPHNFSGSPLMANFQSAVFYPFNFMYLIFPQIWAWSGLVMLQPFLALLFTFFYARKIGISRLGSYFASISFSFSSFMAVWLEYNTIGHVILWLPLILLSLEKLFEKRTIIWSLILVISIISSLFAGHIQIFTYLLIFVLIYSIARIRKISLFLISLFTLSLGIGAVQLLPGIELITQAARSAHSYDFIINKILIQPWQLVMLFVPDFFGNPATRNYFLQDTYIGKVTSVGIVPLFFATLTFFKRKNKYIKFFLSSSVIILLFVTLNPITYFFYKIQIPFISDSAPTLAVFLLCFSLSILAGFGVDFWQKEKPFSFFLLFGFFWGSLLFVPKQFFSVSFHNLFYSTLLLTSALIIFSIPSFYKKSRAFVLILLLLLTIFDQWRSFSKFNPFSPKETVFPNVSVLEFLKKNAGISRFWGYGSGAMEANFATQYSIFATDGYDPLYPKRYGEFIQASKDGKIQIQFTTQTRSDAVAAPGFGETDLADNKSRLRVLDLLGVKYILDRRENASSQETFPLDRFALVYEKDGWKIFENKKAVPRVFLSNNYKVFSSIEEFEKIFFDNSFDVSKTILLEENPGFKTNILGKTGELKLLSYLPNEINIKVKGDSNNLLFLSDTYYPGWKAYLDGKEVKIYRADYAFRAVAIPSGIHGVKFLYNPIFFKVGYITSLVSLVSLVILMLTIKKRRYNI